ncbi:MAG: hypothetical protein HLUCCO06_16265 [Halomonas sp. HL-93]|nr:MAG: hypothetical protein HLUCCO06_16265 [Halomonas sp. HL-93]
MLTKTSSAYQRELAFQAAHGNLEDTATILPIFVLAQLRAQALVVGETGAGAMAAALLDRLGIDDGSDWEQALLNEVSQVFSEWPIGEDIHLLDAYAFFGIDYCGPEGRSVDEIAQARGENLATVEKLADLLPLLRLWADLAEAADTAEADFKRLVAASRSRIALDTGARVPVEGLSVLAGISDSRMRNIAKRSADAILPVGDDRAVAHDRAKAWLDDQDHFLPTVTCDFGHEEESHEITNPIFVPVAADGSRFDTTLRRAQGYQVGPKGAETWVAEYDAALAMLTRMPVACWRRPSESSGRHGIVRATHWERVSGDDVLFSE